MASNGMIKIDGLKLRRILNERKILLKTASEEIGYEESFISKCIIRGSMTKQALKALELRYGIKADDIKSCKGLYSLSPSKKL